MNKELKDKIASFLGLQKSRLGVVSTVNADGGPESAFVYYTFDENLNIYFATKDSSRKFKNILQNKKVAFAMATENPPQTLQLEGEASVHSENGDQKHLFQELVGLATAKNFSAPIEQEAKTGGIQFLKITPSWIRLGNFEVRKHGDVFEEIIS